jgi:hypothetical protein
MAPPIPGLRQSAPTARTTGDIVAGVAAIAALAILTVGVPAALITVFGLPIPHHVSMSAFTQRLSLDAIMKVLAAVVWLAWLQLVWCVIAEVRAAVRSSGMPQKVPLAGGTQSLVHRLVTTALLLATASAVIAPAIMHSAPTVAARPGAAVTASARGPSRAADADAATAETSGRHRAEKIYVVQPPAGRYHESLWEIAQNHLGNGRRYGEIFELNKDRVQPDGTKLTIASLIRPGWVLRMPGDAHGPGIEAVTPGEARAAQRGDVGHGAVDSASLGRWAAEHGVAAPETGRALEAASAAETDIRPIVEHGVAQHGPAIYSAANPSAAGSQGANGHQLRGSGPDATAQPGTGIDYPRDLAAATLLAAGLLTALGRRRREQLWRRAFGARLPVPGADAGAAEVAIRLGAGEEPARLLDLGLRHLAMLLAGQGRPLPGIYAARLSADYLDLSIEPADQNPPWPWMPANAGRVWRLPLSAVAGLSPGSVSSVGAPFPGLVSIGTDDDGRVLVDLEAASGLIALDGPADLVRAALAAMAAELATNRWSDEMHITLVGFGTELTLIAPDRVLAVDSLAEVLPALEARAAEADAAASAAGTDWVLTGRTRGVNPGPWTPHYLIMAEPPAPDDLDRLLALARSGQRTGAGYLVAGDLSSATWSWTITEDRRLRAGLLGFDVAAQLLPAGQYAAVAELFAGTAADPVGPTLDDPPASVAPAAQLVPGARMPVEIGLLGPASVQAPGAIEPERAALSAEIVVYLAAHPDGVHPNVLTSVIWPRGVGVDVAEAALTRVTDWLGYDPSGRPHLATDSDGRLRLGPQVRVDWQVFRALAARAGRDPVVGSAGEEDLARALSEVRGPLLDGHDQRRYAWLATDGLESEVTARVADVAHQLSTLRRAGDPPAAMAAARAGLRLAADDELLWRDLLLAADAVGDPATLADIVAEITARAAANGTRVAPQTESLIDELLPAWRASVA